MGEKTTFWAIKKKKLHGESGKAETVPPFGNPAGSKSSQGNVWGQSSTEAHWHPCARTPGPGTASCHIQNAPPTASILCCHLARSPGSSQASASAASSCPRSLPPPGIRWGVSTQSGLSLVWDHAGILLALPCAQEASGGFTSFKVLPPRLVWLAMVKTETHTHSPQPQSSPLH